MKVEQQATELLKELGTKLLATSAVMHRTGTNLIEPLEDIDGVWRDLEALKKAMEEFSQFERQMRDFVEGPLKEGAGDV